MTANENKTMVRIRPETRKDADEIAGDKGWTLAETFSQGIKLLKKSLSKPRRQRAASSER